MPRSSWLRLCCPCGRAKKDNFDSIEATTATTAIASPPAETGAIKLDLTGVKAETPGTTPAATSERKSSLTPRDFDERPDPTSRELERRRSSHAMQLGFDLRQAPPPLQDDDDEPTSQPWTPRSESGN